jgi:hypothetical protein
MPDSDPALNFGSHPNIPVSIMTAFLCKQWIWPVTGQEVMIKRIVEKEKDKNDKDVVVAETMVVSVILRGRRRNTLMDKG